MTSVEQALNHHNEFIAALLRQLPNMSTDVRQSWVENPGALKRLLAPLAPPKSYLTRLFVDEKIIIGKTLAKTTIAGAKDVFGGWIDGDFKNWDTNKPGIATKASPVEVYEISKNGTFQDFLGSLGDFKQRCLTQGQIVEFCRKHRNRLRQERYGTFFPFEVNGERFVADVVVGDGELEVGVDRFGRGRVIVWDADRRHRLVVRQQTV